MHHTLSDRWFVSAACSNAVDARLTAPYGAINIAFYVKILYS